MTAAVRDLHRAWPGRFLTDVDTPFPDLWLHNPFLTPLAPDDPTVRTIDMHYPLVHASNDRPRHFIEGYSDFLSSLLSLPIPTTAFGGDIHLSKTERSVDPFVTLGIDRFKPVWIVVAGGKHDFTAKWWDPRSAQAVVDRLANRVTFVQCGDESDWHPRLERVVDLIGRSSIREFVSLVYHADGVLCPVTFAMHLAAAVPLRDRRLKPCVVVGGGREPPHWEAYPGHQFLHTIGVLGCCATGGCWRSRCQTVGDGDIKDRANLCELPVQIAPDLKLPMCMTLMTPDRVVNAIEVYL